MHVLLILNNKDVTNLRVMVELTKKEMIERVVRLMEENREREAFELLRRKAEVRHYLPLGKKPPERPALTLFEDML